MRVQLPVADAPAVRRYARQLTRRHTGPLFRVVALHGLAALAGLVTPFLLGRLIGAIEHGTTVSAVDGIAVALVVFVLVQAVLTRFAAFSSANLGERVLAELREEFVDRVLAIPLSTVERAGTGDLVTRTSRDVAQLSHSVRRGVPESLIAAVTLVLTAGALIWLSPLLALPCLVGAPIIIGGARWYLRRAPKAYLRENAASSEVIDGLTETFDGARTTEALRTGARRITRTDRDLHEQYLAERGTLRLRTVFWPVVEVGFVLPVVATLFLGGWFYIQGWAELAQVVTAVFYVQQLVEPIDRLLGWADELQVGATSLARLLGVAEAGDDRTPGDARPDSEQLTASDVRYAYTEGRDVLHGVDLTIAPGERLAMVGPSGAGKSTLGRLLAGIDGPRTGSVAVGGAPLVELPLEELRGHVALVTQEHHVFLGTLRDNLALAKPSADDAEIRRALAAVDALDWVDDLPEGLATEVGSGRHEVSPAQAQQLALARLVLADPHTLVLDEATSLIDPRAARHLERTLAAVLDGRTVVAIAHRLFSAHDADRVAVVEDGRITELGSHDDLVAADGSYAALWRSWQS
ncbi:multidrug ABC transporter ATP-binding protein [Catellatospora sp. IY07-71]|uniref:ABC transporter ATP-binding protein n=1 Tax=Catellatospora sp. IY07-71 TaxID=2728827 RepID=UPI001BB3DD1A|nr:ABC transporter ATP-binding protein [Catellatospora sp. IY07-71]BCJ71100.1 multidrug ABC transporter ATP-binding protein [Catellatospora sp. IY07-71]